MEDEEENSQQKESRVKNNWHVCRYLFFLLEESSNLFAFISIFYVKSMSTNEHEYASYEQKFAPG